jgi:hypothetical protein
MTKKIVAIDVGGGHKLPLLQVSEYAVSLQVTDPDAGPWEDDCCCNCDPFTWCLACLEDGGIYTSTTDVSWPDDVTRATIKAWGPGGEPGISGGAGEAGGGGGGGGFAIVRPVGKNDDHPTLHLWINDEATDYITEVFNGDDTSPTITAAPGEKGGDGPNGVGGAGGGGFTIGGYTKNGGNGADGSDNHYGGGGGGGAGDLVGGGDAFESTGGEGGLRKGGRGGDGENQDAETDGTDGQDYGGGAAGGFDERTFGQRGKGAVQIFWWHKKELQLTIDGAPHDSRLDCCPPTPGSYYQSEIIWSNINKTFTLEQQQAGDSTFCWNALDEDDLCDHDTLSAKAILIETGGSGTPFGCDGPFYQQEFYVIGVCASIGCESGRMAITGLGFTFASCGRSNGISGWGPWYCGCEQVEYFHFPCSFGDDLETAAVCSTQTMRKRINWPTIISATCALGVDCETMTDGTAEAELLSC